MPSVARRAPAIEDVATDTAVADRATAVGYRPGLVSRFIARVDELPWHGWWVYGAIALGLLGWGQAILWASGLVAVGVIDPTLAILVPYGPYALAALALGRLIGLRALTTFWPATGWPDGDRLAWRTRFAGAPAQWEAAAVVIGGFGGLVVLISAPTTGFRGDASRAALALAYAPTYVLGYSSFAVGAVLSTRWLWLVTRIHREARAIDLFDSAPIHAFSRLTVTVGFALLVGLYYSLSVNAASQAGNVPSLVFLAAAGVLSAVAFVAPLWGIHERLVEEKRVLLLDVERRTTAAGADLFARVDRSDYAITDNLNSALSGLGGLHDRIVRLPTWPWPPQVFRGFVSALLLPIVVFAVTRLIALVVGT